MERVYRMCPMCGGINYIEVDDKVANAIGKWERMEIYIQDIPLSANEREFIKTGYCMSCQDVLFSPWEDEEEEEVIL